jgi:hypothetical protein
MKYWKGFLFCILVVLAQELVAQTKMPDPILARLKAQFVNFDKLISSPHIGSSPGNNVSLKHDTLGMTGRSDMLSGKYHSLLEKTSKLSWTDRSKSTKIDSAISREYEALFHELMSSTGLKAMGQTYYRPWDALGENEDNDEVSRYYYKVQAEVRWDFLHSSLYKRKGRINELVLNERIAHLKAGKDRRQIPVNDMRESLRQNYDQALASVLLWHIDNLKLLTDAQEYLLKTEDISSDQLLQLLNERADCERQLVTLDPKAILGRASNLSTPANVTIVIDTLRLYSTVLETSPDANLLALQQKQCSQQAANTSYLSQCTFSPFVRYSYYVRKQHSNSSNLDVGLSFSLPLYNEASHKRKTLMAQKELLSLQQHEQETQLIDKLRTIVVEVNRLNRASTGELNRLRELRKYLSMRNHAYKNSVGGYNMLARAKEYNNYFSCWEKLLSYQYQRDCLIVNLQEFLPDTSVVGFCSTIQQ